jgi:TolA-binding protein
VRDAWLARIRELAADGNIEDARASLHEFQHRYPDYPLPQDLRALLP